MAVSTYERQLLPLEKWGNVTLAVPGSIGMMAGRLAGASAPRWRASFGRLSLACRAVSEGNVYSWSFKRGLTLAEMSRKAAR